MHSNLRILNRTSNEGLLGEETMSGTLGGESPIEQKQRLEHRDEGMEEMPTIIESDKNKNDETIYGEETMKRYEISMNGFESGLDIKETGDGDWVKYEDFEAEVNRIVNKRIALNESYREHIGEE